MILDVRTSYTVLQAEQPSSFPTFPLMLGRMYGVEVRFSDDDAAVVVVIVVVVA